MNILNKKKLRRQIREGKEISLDGILEEFKSLLRESLQTASEEELTSHLGYEKHQESENTRDREGTFEPKLVPKRERILKGSEDLILSLYAKGMSVADISTHLDDLYGYQLSEQTISNITEAIMDKAKDWQNRPLEAIYPIVFMDATVLKIRVDRVVKNIAAYIMLGITLEGKKEILGIWIGENETSKYWLTLLNELKNRGVKDILIFAIDGLNGFNQAIQAIYPKAEIQRCIVNQIRSSLKFVSWKDTKAVAKDLKTIYSAVTEEDVQLALTEFNDILGQKYPHILQSSLNNWNELSTFFKYQNLFKH